mmetsp:Transcript_58374/g.130097  ORF Transcript_58374/g.130097 Transcript_58374/m.130097 type:complete len:211 (+) Transcript_58374:428-1060(+)
MYSNPPSVAKWLCLPIIIGGVVFSCLKPDAATGAYTIEFDLTALTMASIANVFAAIKGAENSKLMKTKGLKDRIGGVGNQFALTEVLGFFISLPVMVCFEGKHFGAFVSKFKSDAVLSQNVILSGMTFYLYNELATMTIKKTSAVTASVANTAKRVIVMVVSAVAFGEELTFEKKVGATIAIAGVFIYSVIDDILNSKARPKPSSKDKKL